MSDSFNTVLAQKLNDINRNDNSFSSGRISMVRQYVVKATGLLNVRYFERVYVGESSLGYVDAINRDSVMIALTYVGEQLKVGDIVMASGKIFSLSYSPYSVGHIIDMFGNDRLTGNKLKNIKRLPVEGSPIPIMDRISVNRPLLTGITGIDLMYPIGRGQRQLIIGDRKTGKTQIALDTIFNQKDQDILCIYVAIGKTKKEVKEIYAQLLRRGAMDYTVIFAAFNDDSAPTLRNTPYAALSVAKKYMEQGRDVLVVLDDLKRHADVCREIALLMGKTPGRDAYPPDIFYSHARMLELGCQHKNGGSITILPICETKSGDITDYISTNIISITDGQIVMSAKNFEKGIKPAINYGLSVSRLGSAVQADELKSIGSVVRRTLLTYLEQKDVFEMANEDEMSPAIRQNLKTGADIISMLCQGKFQPRTADEMLQASIEALGEQYK